ncbi:hypothetical protein FRC10_005666 [Ceratobasidium sp. 414]|nr:hypothetical protein FRC10_005666 [Ceratobasidium sp. 414]
MKLSVALSLVSAALVQAGTVVWDGSFDPFTTPDDFAKWSWSSQVGTYQYYIHGSGPPSDYLALSPSYKNPAITRESKGLKMSISPNATWNSQMFNFAYDIDFSAGTVGLWASTGSGALTKVIQNIAVSTSTNSADFHVGVLRIVNQAGIEDWYVSGVYIESGPITTAIGSGSGTGSTTTTSAGSTITQSASSSTTKTTSVATTTTTAAGATATHYGQCGGTGYTGPTVCASPYTCTAVSPPFYYQCL